MPITISGDSSASGAVRDATAAIVEIKQFWTNAWTLAPFLKFLGATANTAREGAGSCTLEYHYGPSVKEVYQTGYASTVPLDLRNYWVKISLAAPNGVITLVWIGRITGETRDIYAQASQPAGRQTFTALEPLHLLERVKLSRSVWRPDGVAEENALSVGFIPAMNARDDWRMLVGNKSSGTVDGEYVYGGTQRWSRLDYAKYLLNFVDELDDATPANSTGPGWVMGGQMSVLEEVKDIVGFGDVVSIADALRKLIDARIGLDFKIVATEFSGTQGGFEVQVFALNAADASFGGETMPKNSQTLNIKAINARDFESLTVVRDAAQRYGRIRVLGRRIVCAVTLKAEGETPSLVKRWSAARETEYEAGAGAQSSDTKEHDLARTGDKFAKVYQDYGAPDDWNFNDGAAAPVVNTATGELLARDGSPAGGVFAQRQVRKTLAFVPIQDESNSYIPPQAWLYDEEEKRYVTAQAAGMTVYAAMDDWGLRIEANPNHLLGKNHFVDSPAGTDTDPKYDYSKLVVTIAFETDQRIELIYETGETAGADWKPSDGELVIEDDTAELWYVCAGTVKEVDQDGKLVTVEGNDAVIVRNDVRQMYRWMAGAIGRYVNARGRADLVMRGWHAYSHALGTILAVVEEQGDSHQIQAPVTSVEYAVAKDGSGTQTIVRAGFAR